MTKDSTLSGRTYIITGSASGIGAAAAQRIRELGGTVVGCDLHDAEIAADLSSDEGRRHLVDEAGKLPAVNGVLAVAGGSYRGVVETNYFGAVATLTGLRPFLARSAAPRAVVVSSVASFAPPTHEVVAACLADDEPAAVEAAERLLGDNSLGKYGSAKNALNRWVRRVAPSPDWAGAGIPLNVVGPGVVDTPMASYIFESDETRRRFEEACPQPLGFPGKAEWVADLLVWLTSPENAFVTGQIIFADGGIDASVRGEKVW